MLAQQFPGVKLALSARREDKLRQVAASCPGTETLIIPTDFTQSEQVEKLSEIVLDRWGRVDALVNNAGYGQMGPIELTTAEGAKTQFEVNFHSPLTVIRNLIPVMRNQGGGRIINISSLGGKMAFPGGGLYSASKFALEALSDVLRMELHGFNIKVSVIEPGPVVTEFFQAAWQEVKKTIPEPETTLYAPVFSKIENIDKQLKALGWTSEQVAKIVVKALKSAHPRSRYYAATGGGIFVPLMTKIMPTWFTDAFWKNFYGIDEVEKAWKEQLREKEIGL
jgi:short-subunit dehydrogenase